MNPPAIYRIVTNGRKYAIQRKGSIDKEWELVTHYVPTSDFTAVKVPFTYWFRFMARWDMCRLMLAEHESNKTQNETWTEVAP